MLRITTYSQLLYVPPPFMSGDTTTVTFAAFPLSKTFSKTGKNRSIEEIINLDTDVRCAVRNLLESSTVWALQPETGSLAR